MLENIAILIAAIIIFIGLTDELFGTHFFENLFGKLIKE